MPYKDLEVRRAKARERAKRYRDRHPERARASWRRWRAGRIEEQRAAKREYMREYRRRHPEAYRQWADENRPTIAAHARARRARARAAPGGGVSVAEWEAILVAFGHRCAYCAARGRMEQEHLDPLVHGGAHDPSNVVPACRRCNARKKDRTLLRWPMRRPSMIRDLLTPVRDLHSTRCGTVRGKRWGVLLHFDDSASDAGAVAWFRDPRCQVSYQRLYLDNGDVVQVAPMDRRAWHAGVCRPGPWGRDANSAFYGLAAATNAKQPVTPKQYASIVHDTIALFWKHGWSSMEVDVRILGHDEIACFADGRLGRKIDPTGYDETRPILSTAAVRLDVREHLLELGR